MAAWTVLVSDHSSSSFGCSADHPCQPSSIHSESTLPQLIVLSMSLCLFPFPIPSVALSRSHYVFSVCLWLVLHWAQNGTFHSTNTLTCLIRIHPVDLWFNLHPIGRFWVFQCILTFNGVFSAMFQPFFMLCMSVCSFNVFMLLLKMLNLSICPLALNVTHVNHPHLQCNGHGTHPCMMMARTVMMTTTWWQGWHIAIWIDRIFYLSCIGCQNAAICTEYHYRWEWQPLCTKYQATLTQSALPGCCVGRCPMSRMWTFALSSSKATSLRAFLLRDMTSHLYPCQARELSCESPLPLSSSLHLPRSYRHFAYTHSHLHLFWPHLTCLAWLVTPIFHSSTCQTFTCSEGLPADAILLQHTSHSPLPQSVTCTCSLALWSGRYPPLWDSAHDPSLPHIHFPNHPLGLLNLHLIWIAPLTLIVSTLQPCSHSPR